MREYVREHVTLTGDYARINLYPVRADKSSRTRGAKRLPTSEAQARLNAENSAHRLADLVHTNFTPDDTALHLTYSDKQMPEDASSASRLVYNYMRRLARLYAKKYPDAAFRWIAVTEVSSTGRVHHHLIISGGLTIEELSDKWGRGHTQARPLEFDETGLVGLATYITKSRTSYRRWQASKNLAKPAVRESDFRIRKKDVRYITKNPTDEWFISKLHPGYALTPGSLKLQPDTSPGRYFVSYMLYKTDNDTFRYDKNGILRQKRKRRRE